MYNTNEGLAHQSFNLLQSFKRFIKLPYSTFKGAQNFIVAKHSPRPIKTKPIKDFLFLFRGKHDRDTLKVRQSQDALIKLNWEEFTK